MRLASDRMGKALSQGDYSGFSFYRGAHLFSEGLIREGFEAMPEEALPPDETIKAIWTLIALKELAG